MATLTFAEVQDLVDRSGGTGLMVSCYADLSVTEGFRPAWQGPFKAQSDQLKQMLADEGRAWQECSRNLGAIRKALESPEARGARGMAVFCAQQRDFFEMFPLDVPVENRLVVHPTPYLVPLLEVLARQHEYLVVHTDTHRGRLYAARPGAVRVLEEIAEEVPKKHRAEGGRYGRHQLGIAAYRADRIQHYQKDLVDRIEKAWAGHPFRGILLLGEHEVLGQLRGRLPSRLAGAVGHEAPLPWAEKPLGPNGEVRALLEGAERAEDARILARLKERVEEGHGIAAGPEEVLDALQSGRVGPRGHGYLVVGPDPQEAVARCTACRSLFTDMPATCPRCQAPCADANLWEEVLLLALRHNLTVHCVKADDTLTRLGGMAAVLPRPGRVPAGAGTERRE
jgi:peptide subunit release factor 1 (eRF1)